MTETRYIEGQGRYALAEMVGRCGFATVWRARSLKGSLRGKDVAVKVIPVYSAGERSRALREGQIAEGLSLSVKTVANHLSAVFAKLQVADRTQAILRARDAGLGHP